MGWFTFAYWLYGDALVSGEVSWIKKNIPLILCRLYKGVCGPEGQLKAESVELHHA